MTRITKHLQNFKIVAFLAVSALIIGLTLYLVSQQQDNRQRASDLAYIQNEYLQVWDSRVFPGIIDLFYKDNVGNWQQYNNVVPIARVNGVWANAELDRATITREFISNDINQQQVKYQFSPLSNGAHFYLIMTLIAGKPEVQFQVKLNTDSAPVDALALGNYYGYVQLVRYLKINTTTYDALTYPKPNPDGNYTLGRFTRHPYPTNMKVEFWGENGIRQYQYVDVPLSSQDEMVSEIRYTPWLPQQPAPGKNWFETVHITRSPFTDSKSVWHFGYVLPATTPTPTPFFSPPPPTRTPTPTIIKSSPTPTIPSPTITLNPTPTLMISTPTPTATTGTINVTTSPSVNAKITIVDYKSGKIILTGTKSISNSTLPIGSYYVSFSKYSFYRTPKVTIFYVKANKTTKLIGDYKWGMVYVSYK